MPLIVVLFPQWGLLSALALSLWLCLRSSFCQHLRACQRCFFFSRARAMIKYFLRAASTLENTTVEQWAFRKLSASSNPSSSNFKRCFYYCYFIRVRVVVPQLCDHFTARPQRVYLKFTWSCIPRGVVVGNLQYCMTSLTCTQHKNPSHMCSTRMPQPSTQAFSSRSLDSTWCETEWGPHSATSRNLAPSWVSEKRMPRY